MSDLMLPQFPSIKIETEPTTCLTDNGQKRNLTDRLEEASFYFSVTHCSKRVSDGRLLCGERLRLLLDG
jgi:hypothetical protein